MSRRIGILAGPYRVDDQLGGIGLRLWEIAQVLADAGHRVTIAAPHPSPFTHPGIRITTAPARKVVDTCEVVLTTDLPDTTLLLHAHRTGVRIVAENAPPVEHLHYTTLTGDDGAELYRDTVARWRLQLLLADHLLVRSEAEHASVLGALVTAGRMSVAHHQTDPGLAHLVSLVPLGFTRHAAATAATADAAAVVTEGACDLLWNGGVWDYCHPAPVLTALARLGPGAPVLRLMYAPSPGRRRALEEQAGRLGVGHLLRWPDKPVGHRERDGWVKAARALVFTGGRTAENATCHRLRLRDAALYRLPVVVDPYGASGDLVRALGIGPVADPDTPDALAGALLAATADGPPRTGYLTALDRAAGRFTLERTLRPLLAWLDTGHRAPDRNTPDLVRAVDGLLAAHPALTGPAPRLI